MTATPLPALPPPHLRRHYREQMGLTLQQAADLLTVSSRAVHRWEKGTTPTPGNQRRYAALLQVWEKKINNNT